MSSLKTMFGHRKILPWLVLAGLLLVAALALYNPPTVDRSRPERGPSLTVSTEQVKAQHYRILVSSFGTVQPRTQSNLVSQVSGEVMWVSPQFRDGGVFREGDALLKIDTRDYEADVQIARATLLSAQQSLAEEEAQSQQASEDWERLGDGSPASELVLRKPQLMAAQASTASAEAALRKAELNLERATITAPFDGRILSTAVDRGEVIGSNSQLAEIYATDYVEIRLPIANSDLDYIHLPEPDTASGESETQRVSVDIHSSLTTGPAWPGFLVRTEGAIDSSSRQLHVVAQVDDPFKIDSSKMPQNPLKIGEYVTARIHGRTLNDAIVIDNSSIYQGSYVYVVVDGLLQRRDIHIAWQNETDAVIDSGLSAGDALVITPLGQVTSGTRVAIAGQEKTRPERKQGNAKPMSKPMMKPMSRPKPQEEQQR